VVDPLPEPAAAASGPPGAGPRTLGFELPGRLGALTDAKDLLMDFSDGVADGRLVPVEALVQGYTRALRLKGPELLQSSEFKGLPRLRNALAEHLAQRRALALDPEQLLLVRSTSMAVSLVAQALIGPGGGAVGVEDPGNPAVWATLRQASGATLVGLPVEGQGRWPEALAAPLARQALSLLVLSPQCHYPTGVAMAPERRRAILDLASRYRFPILELDPEFDYLLGEAASHPPLAAMDATGQVIYAGSLSRTLAPGLRLAYLALPVALME
jgi:GntR family transcriptional regulator/MocR family aminotransferase